MSTPKIDSRDRAAILTQLEQLALDQVPELSGSDLSDWRSRGDAGYTVLQLFSYMVDHVVTQLNMVPEKNLIAYLNMIGTKLLPAQPAKTPVQFILNQAAVDDISIPQGTQISTAAKDSKPAVIFETERPITATVSNLAAVISVDPTVDQVFDHLAELSSDKKETTLFVSPQSQEHSLFLGDDSLFNLKKGEGYGRVSIILDAETSSPIFDSNVKWSYSFQDSGKDEADWIDFTKITTISSSGKERVTLRKTNKTATENKTVNDVDTFWIRAQFTGQLPKELKILNSLAIGITNEVRPDLAFYNDVPIDLSSRMYFPFGKQPNTSDIFYIGSREGFSKKNTQVQIQFFVQPGTPGKQCTDEENADTNLLISWEYWDGKTWSNLKDVTYMFNDNTELRLKKPQVTFTCPNDMTLTKVNSKEDFWIRARIASGNYRTVILSSSPTIEDNPPSISDIIITNLVSSQPVTYCLAKNNLQFESWGNRAIPFQPFVPLDEETQTLYLGFDKPFGPEGIISVFFSLINQEYLAATKPQVAWSYLSTRNDKQEWASIQVVDDTDNFTTGGAVEFLAPDDISAQKKFNKVLYWVRAEVVANQFASLEQRVQNYVSTFSDQTNLNVQNMLVALRPIARFFNNPAILQLGQQYLAATSTISNVQPTTSIRQPCTPISVFHPTFSYPNAVKETPAAPIAYSISLNTTSAIQAETVSDEVLGTSDGTVEPSFSLSRSPVVSETVWVSETPSPEATGLTVVTTDTGETWVQWQAVEDFSDSNETSRHYTIDRATGKIQFGNGQKGMIPPIGATIKATYQTGGGTQGNVASGDVKNLVSAIALVDKAVNIDSAEGGAETESVERAEEKAPKRVQHRQRAVAKEDYEWLSMEASGAVARAKCIPNLNSEGKQELGCVAVIIVPSGTEDKPVASPTLVRIVEDYLKSRCPVSVSTLTVTVPTYLGVSVNADVYVTSIDSASNIKFNALNQIKSFLHPLYGGPDGKGWDFGVVPCALDLMAIIQKTPDVDHVENLAMTLNEEQTGDSFLANEAINLPGYILIYSGTHKITVKLSEAP